MKQNELKPYLIRAILELCADRGLTPYMVVAVNDECRVPDEFVRDGMIVFDISSEATNRFEVTDEKVSFQARFGEDNRIVDIYVPMETIAFVFPMERQDLGLQFDVTPEEKPEKKETKETPVTPRRPTRLK